MVIRQADDKLYITQLLKSNFTIINIVSDLTLS